MKIFTRLGLLVLFSLLLHLSLRATSLLGAPVAVDDENYGPEGTTLNGDLSDNDSDPEGGALTYSVVSGPSYGVIVVNSDGTYTYVPQPEFNGFDYITYQVCDPEGLCDQGILEIAMLFANDNPQANNDTFNVFQGNTLNGNVSSNDVELDEEINWWTILSPPSGASFFQLNLNGTFTYIPEEDFEGQDVFIYRACDPCGACDFAFAYINVLPPNDPPVALNDYAFIPEDMILNGNVATNDDEPDGETMTFSVQTPPSHGSLTLNSNGTFTFIPTLNYYGADSFTYLACDVNNQCSAATVTLDIFFVNDPPIANDDYLYVNEDMQGVMAVGDNDIEYDIEFLQYIHAYGPDHGSVIWDESTGQFQYTPEENYFGEDVIGYFALDPCGVMDFAEVIVTINPVNDPPVAESDDYEAVEDEVLEGTVAENDFDIDNALLTYTLNTVPVIGTIEWNSDGTFVFTPYPNEHGEQLLSYTVSDLSGGTDNAWLTIFIEPINDLPVANDDLVNGPEDSVITGSVATNDVDADETPLTFTFSPGSYNGIFSGTSNGSFTYTPFEDYFGTITINYQVCDIFGACDNGVLTINVQSVNDLPMAVDDSFLVAEESTLNATVADNDSDPESTLLTFSVVSGPVFGIINMSINGDFSYTPIDNWNGFESILYEVCDTDGGCSTAELVIEVLFVNDLPQPQADVFSMNEDGVLVGNVATNDIEPEDEIMYFVLLSNPSQGQIDFNWETGAFTFTPNANFTGTVNMSYLACDPCTACEIATFTINVLPVNDAPVAVDDTFNATEDLTLSGTVAINDSDIDNSSNLTYSLASGVQNGTINLLGNGTFSYTPSANYSGINTFTYNVCDPSGACDQGLATITVNAVNDAPVAEEDEYLLYEDGSISASVSSNDTDSDDANLTYTLLSTPSFGTIEFLPNGSFTYNPIDNFYGNDVFTYMACDNGGLCSNSVAALAVVPVNDAPVAANDIVGTIINVPIAGSVAPNDTDIDGDALSFEVVVDAINGDLVFNEDGSFSYLPNNMFNGTETITYLVCDLELLCDQGTLTIEVVNDNIIPVATDDSFSMNEDETLTASVGTNDSDDGSILHYEMIATPESGFCVMSNDGSFSFTPPANFFGTVHFSYEVCDIFGACDIAEVAIEILPVNDVPTAQDDVNSQLEDVEESGWVSLNDNDLDEDELSYTILSGPNHGTINWIGNGAYIYSPDENFFGDDFVEYEVCDPSGACATATLTLAVLFVNDLPQVEDELYATNVDVPIEGNVGLNDAELDPEELHYNLLAGPENGSFVLNLDGSFVYTPNDGFIGTETIYYEGCDPCGACDQAILTIQVFAVNTAPFAFDYSTDHCSLSPLTFDLLEITGDGESSDAQLTWTIDNVDAGTWILEGSVLVYTPVYNQSSDVVISYTVCDNALNPLCASASIQLSLSTAYEAEISTAQITDALCFGDNNGSISIDVVDEGYNLNFDWGNEGSGSQIDNLEAGEYTVTITAEEQCSLPHQETYTVSQPEELVIEGLSAIDIDDQPGGSSDYTVLGGTAPYSYQWTNENAEIISESMDLSGLTDASQAGNYFLQVTDANGCVVQQQITITDVVEWVSGLILNLYPNPVADQLVVATTGMSNGSFDYIISDVSGRIVVANRINVSSGKVSQLIDVSALAAGSYHFSLLGNNGILTQTFIKN